MRFENWRASFRKGPSGTSPQPGNLIQDAKLPVSLGLMRQLRARHRVGFVWLDRTMSRGKDHWTDASGRNFAPVTGCKIKDAAVCHT